VTPRISIVVPTRDRAGQLPGAIESIRGQTLADWECIVVDDGSADETPRVLSGVAAAEPRIRSIRRDPGGSIAGARNAALAVARGDLVAFLDDDDRWLPGKLARQVSRLDAEADADFVCGRVERCGDAAGIWPGRPLPARPSLRALLASNFVPTSTVLARRAAVERAGGFDERFPVAEDYDLWIRMAIRAPVLADSTVVARYRVDAARSARQRGAEIEALEAIVSHASASGIPAAWLRPHRRRIHRHRARHARDFSTALAEWRRAIF
jgi:glycosyltransferase involved in cell wall biosynthesis